jgi:hypothetical protein
MLMMTSKINFLCELCECEDRRKTKATPKIQQIIIDFFFDRRQRIILLMIPGQAQASVKGTSENFYPKAL